MINLQRHMSRWKEEEAGTRAPMVPSSDIVQPQWKRRSAQAEEKQVMKNFLKEVQSFTLVCMSGNLHFAPIGPVRCILVDQTAQSNQICDIQYLKS